MEDKRCRDMEVEESLNHKSGTFDEHNLEESAGNILLDTSFITSDETNVISSSMEFIQAERKSYERFDEEFARFLSNFVNQQNKREEQKRGLKKCFFWVIMISFILILFVPFIIILLQYNFSTEAFIAAVLTAAVEVLSAIIVLPKIIAEYLFNKEEDKNMVEIIKSMQNYTEKKHDYIDRNK